MTRLPQLEAQLVAAAARPRARRRLRVAGVAALAVAACILAALLLAPSSEPERRERPVAVPETVPAETLVKAQRLARLPVPPDSRIRDDQVVSVARQEMARMPYPPGMRDEFDYFAHRRNLTNSSSAVRGSVEYHAYCAWVRYWLSGPDRAGAAAVLAHVAYWPLMRRPGDHRPAWFQLMIARSARKGDEARMRHEATTNCRVVR
jgi:hypothetical protein